MDTLTTLKGVPPGVAQLLSDDHKKHAPRYSGYFANHAMPGMVALHYLGADDSFISAWYDGYAKELEPSFPEHGPEEQEKLRSNWQSRLGQPNFFPDYVRFFDAELRRIGPSELINTYVVKLTPGIWTAAFHPLIHTGFAVAAKHEESLVRGLAYLASSYAVVDDQIEAMIARDDQESQDPWMLLNQMNEDTQTWKTLDETPPGFQSKLRALAQSPAQLASLRKVFGSVKAFCESKRISVGMHIEDCLARFTFELFAKTDCNDFFFLHLITGCHALRILIPCIKLEEDKLRAIYTFIYYLLATYAVRGRPKLGALPRPSAAPDRSCPSAWNSVIAAARASNDEHFVKLVWAAKCFWDDEDKDQHGDRSLMLSCAERAREQLSENGAGWKF